MLENDKYTNYNDHTTLLEESSDQVDTTLEIDDVIKENESPVIKNNNTHVFYDICHHFQKTMSVKDSVLFAITIIICTVTIASTTIFYLDEKREYNTYHFTPDYKVYLFNYRDPIDTEEELRTILMDPSIVKNYTPKKGDFITKIDSKLCLESYEHVESRNNIYSLVNKQARACENNQYQFNPNIVTVSKKPMLAEKIKTAKVQNALLKNDDATINKNNVRIGSFVLINMEGQYKVILDENLSQEHLVDASKNKLIDIDKLI